MKILIIEDNDLKYNSIKDYLNELSEENVTRKKSINGGLMELRNNFDKESKDKYNLLILDMQLPRYEDEPYKIIETGGISIMKEIERKDWPINIIFCSSESIEINDFEKCPQLLGAVKYNSSVYLLPEFKKYIDKINNLQPEETFINIYYSFDSNAIKNFPTRKLALDYIREDFDEEVRIQTVENKKVVDKDIFLTDDIENGEYAKMVFANGDIIEWSIPDIL
jgi:CheY-like chemotaxis protein